MNQIWNVKCSMKTRYFSLLAVCGALAGPGLWAHAVEAESTQPAPSAVPSSAAPEFSGRINDVVALTKSGVDESIVLSFVKASPGPFEPSADEIIKLRDQGVSSQVITAMLQRGAEVRDEARAASATYAQTPEANPSQAPVITETPPSTPPSTDTSYADYGTQPASSVVYIGGNYGYPYYTYPYYYSGWYSSAFFYPFPCWFGGHFYAHGCYFPHGGFVHDNFHMHDNFHGGFVAHGGGFHNGFTGGFHGGFAASGPRGGFVASGPRGGFVAGGFHGNTVGGGFHGGSIGFHGGTPTGGFHSAPMGGGFSGGFHGGMSGGFHGGGGGGFHGGGGGGGFHH